MATIRQKSWGWEAQILRRGRTAISRTFRIKADASAWANQVESEIARGVCRDRSQGERFSLDGTLVRYRAEVTPCKKSAGGRSPDRFPAPRSDRVPAPVRSAIPGCGQIPRLAPAGGDRFDGHPRFDPDPARHQHRSQGMGHRLRQPLQPDTTP